MEVCVARELTKLHEEWLYGSVADVRTQLAAREKVRGEFVVVIAAVPQRVADDVDAWIEALWREGVAPATIKAVVARATGLGKSEVWSRLEALKG